MCFKSHVNNGKHETCLFKVGGDFEDFQRHQEQHVFGHLMNNLKVQSVTSIEF